MASNVPGGEKHFVDQHREKLIQRITMIPPVLDILLQEGLLTQEHYDTVKTKKTPQEKMRGLYKYSRGWSFTDKDIFYRALQASNPGVMEHLKGTSLSGLRKIVADDRIQELSIQYMTSMKERYGRVKEHNSRIGESVNLDKRYTQLLLIKNYQNQQEREFGISSIRPLQRRDDRSSAEDSPTTIQALFDPDEDGFTPKIVVLQGPAGIGKTMTSQKIVLDWASGNLFQDCFDFVFSLSCRELNNIPRNISLAGLLSRLCTLQCPEEMMRSVLSNPRKLLFIIDGLDELRWSLEDPSEVCEDPFQETHLKVILRSLLNKQVLYGASAIVTTRPFVLKELENLLQQSRHVEILGFTEEDCEKYVYNFFDDKDVAEKVLGLIKENRIIFAMCSIPISCWIVCTVMKQEMKRDFDLSRCRTTTSIYVLYLKGLIKYHGRKQLVLTCLRRVCALANEGVFRKQILFEEADLRRHGLSMTEVESVFLNESIFHRDIGVSTSYGFIHLTVQEFFAALYYVLEEALAADQEVSRAKEVLSSPHMYFGKPLIRTFNVLPHLSLMVQFLYGLSDINQAKELSEILSCDISFQATPAMRSWLGSFSLYVELTDDRLCCLYEMQDENVVRKVMSVMEFFKVSFSRDMNCVRQLVYFLKNCKPFQRMKFSCEKMDSKDLQMLSPFLQKCSLIQFSCSDSIVSEGLLSLMSTSKSLKKLVLFRPPLEDFEVCDLCDALRRPGCTLEMVRFCCNLNQKTCDKIYSLHGIQTKLDVMFYIEDEMSVYEAQGKFERLRLLGRVLHTCSLWCQRLNQLIGYKVTDDDGDEEIWIYTLSLSTVSQTCLSTVPASLVQFQHDPSSLGPPIHRCALPVWVENLFILRSYFSPS